jgi:NitT/TauT family transport system substrate-binding protein
MLKRGGRVARPARLLVVALLLMVSSMVWAAGRQEGAVEPLRVGYLPFAGFGPVYVAEANGWFDDAGVEVELLLFDSGPPLLEAMAAGEIDMGALGGVPTLRTAAQEVFDMRIISVEADVSGFTQIISGGGFETLADLRGMKVSVPWATTSHYLLGRALAKFGMTTEDVDLVEMEVQDAATAFIAKRLDAFVPAPAQVNLVLEARPDAKVLFRSEDFTKPPGDTTPLFIYDLWVAPKSVIDSRAEDLRTVLAVFHEKTVDYFTNPATSRQAAADLLGWMEDVVGADVGVEEVEMQVNYRKFFDVAEMQDLFASGHFVQLLQAQVDFLVSVGILEESPDFDKVMDASLINGL